MLVVQANIGNLAVGIESGLRYHRSVHKTHGKEVFWSISTVRHRVDYARAIHFLVMIVVPHYQQDVFDFRVRHEAHTKPIVDESVRNLLWNVRADGRNVRSLGTNTLGPIRRVLHPREM